MKTNLKQLVESIKRLSTDDLNKLLKKLNEDNNEDTFDKTDKIKVEKILIKLFDLLNQDAEIKEWLEYNDIYNNSRVAQGTLNTIIILDWDRLDEDNPLNLVTDMDDFEEYDDEMIDRIMSKTAKFLGKEKGYISPVFCIHDWNVYTK